MCTGITCPLRERAEEELWAQVQEQLQLNAQGYANVDVEAAA
jgi:hypothetical protein